MVHARSMPFRVHRTFRLLPGVKVNISKTGISLSLGVRGAGVNASRRGLLGTVGLPGTGISFRALNTTKWWPHLRWIGLLAALFVTAWILLRIR